MVSLIDTFIVPKSLMDIGYYLNEATTQFGYLTGMATSLIGLPIILTTSLAASLVPSHYLRRMPKVMYTALCSAPAQPLKLQICSLYRPALDSVYWRHLYLN